VGRALAATPHTQTSSRLGAFDRAELQPTRLHSPFRGREETCSTRFCQQPVNNP